MTDFKVIQTKLFTEIFQSIESVVVVHGRWKPSIAIRLTLDSAFDRAFTYDLRIYGDSRHGYFMYITLDEYSNLPNGFIIKPENYKDITIKVVSSNYIISTHRAHINTKNIK